jgi:hypothetical protein
VVTKVKKVSEKLKSISQSDKKEQHAIFRVIDGMLTKNKFQTFFEDNPQPTK